METEIISSPKNYICKTSSPTGPELPVRGPSSAQMINKDVIEKCLDAGDKEKMKAWEMG